MHIKQKTSNEIWGLFNVSLLEVGEVGDDNRNRFLQCSYATFLSEDDARNGRNPQAPHVHLRCEGDVVDQFTYDADAGEFRASRSKLVPFIIWYLSGNPTAAELERCPNMESNRSKMAGVPMFENTPFEFTVTELPEERASE